MANYTIIGGDGKEYGPVTDTDIRLWLSEGRLNGQSLAKSESDAEFRQLALFPEFASALGAQRASAAAPVSESTEDLLQRDYDLDIGGCISSGYELYKGNFGTLFGAFVIMFLVQMGCGGVVGGVAGLLNNALTHSPIGVHLAFQYLSGCVIAPVMGPMMGGLFLVYLRAARNETTGAGEIFQGFQQAFLHLFLGSLVVTLITGACMLPFNYVWLAKVAPIFEQMGHMQGDPTAAKNSMSQLFPALTGTLPVLCICLVPVTFFSVCFQFTLPLIVDKGMEFGTAMKTSMKMVLKHWWLLFGFTLVAGLVTCLGLLGCIIGVIFTAPIGMAAIVFAYETIFGTRKT
jgi:hypothetical protein